MARVGRGRLWAVCVVGATVLALPSSALAYQSEAESASGKAKAVALEIAPPNIVVLMLDDMAAMDHRIWDRMPNIKSLFIDQGIEALNYWGNDPLCCPGRANFLTGQVAHVNGVVTNDARLLDPSETIATELDAMGYYTNICGKYLNLTKMLRDKSPAGWDNVAINAGRYYDYALWVNDVFEHHGNLARDYSTDVFAAHCLDFLDDAPADAPVFAFMTPYAPHDGRDMDGIMRDYEPVPAVRHKTDARCAGIAPWDPPNYNSADLTGKPLYVRQRPRLRGAMAKALPLEKRCRSMLAVDDWLGRTVDLLKAQGRYDNTLFIFTSDNGMGYGAFRTLLKSAPHTAQIPLFMTWPAVTGTTPTQISNLLSNVDLAPTLCELAGCEMGPFRNRQPVDGQSFLGLIAPSLSSSMPLRQAIVLEQISYAGVPTWRGLMTDPATHPSHKQWLFVRYVTGERELYDLTGPPCYEWHAGMAGDPCMLKNLSGRQKLVRPLARELAAAW